MNEPLAEFIAVASLIGLLGLGIICFQQSNEIQSLKELTDNQALRIETMEKTLLMSR